MDHLLFQRAGEAILGPEWHRPMSRELGRLHPDGPRDEIDNRMLRRWAAGERPIPDWVPEVLAALAQENIDRYIPRIRVLEALQDDLREQGGSQSQGRPAA